MATRKLFNAATQQDDLATFTVDKNNEIVATFADGNSVKFPAGLDKKGFEQAIADHKEANTGQEVITPEMEAEQAALRANSFDLIGDQDEDTTSDKEQSNASQDTDSA